MDTDLVVTGTGKSAGVSVDISSAEGLSHIPLLQRPTRPSRPSTPEFPYRPSPDVPPWLSKCLKLLTLSNAEEAQEELGRMLEEALERRERLGQEEALASGSGALGAKKPTVITKVAPLPAKSSPSGLKVKLVTEKNKPLPPTKRPRTPSPPLVRLGELSDFSATTVTIPDDVFVSEGVRMSASEETDQMLSDLFPDQVACVVCEQSRESVSNKLLNCQTCRENYHQLCHKPAVTDVDASDPRLVWYCASCKRAVKSAEPLPSPTPSSPTTSPVPSTGGKVKVSSKTAAVSAAPPSLFQRLDSKPTTSTIQSGATGGGLAGLAKIKAIASTAKSEKPLQKRARYLDSVPPTNPKHT